jgi:hypothetical protein
MKKDLAIFVAGDSPLADIFCEKVSGENVIFTREITKDMGALSRAIDNFLVINAKKECIVYLLFDDDGYNIKAFLSTYTFSKELREGESRIVSSLHQSAMGKKVHRHFASRFESFNPSEIAADDFVKSALTDIDENFYSTVDDNWVFAKIHHRLRIDPLLKKALVFLLTVIVSASIFFKLSLSISWLDSLYFVITTMATVGYGDISLKDSSEITKLGGIILMILSVSGISIVFGLFTDSIVRKRMEISYGIKRYMGSGHIIVIGGGSVGYQVILKLMEKGEKPVLVDKSTTGKFFGEIIDLQVPFVLGDARNESVLMNAGIEKAKAVICVTQDDLTNMEVGLDTKSMLPDRRVVLRIFDRELSRSLREGVGIRFSHSMSNIAATQIFQDLDNA